MNRFQTIYASKETGRWGIFDHQYDLGFLGVVYVQDVAASTWSFTHNLNNTPFLIEYFKLENDGTRTDFMPDDIIIDHNTVTVVIGQSLKGSIIMIFTDPS